MQSNYDAITEFPHPFSRKVHSDEGLVKLVTQPVILTPFPQDHIGCVKTVVFDVAMLRMRFWLVPLRSYTCFKTLSRYVSTS